MEKTIQTVPKVAGFEGKDAFLKGEKCMFEKWIFNANEKNEENKRKIKEIENI